MREANTLVSARCSCNAGGDDENGDDGCAVGGSVGGSVAAAATFQPFAAAPAVPVCRDNSGGGAAADVS